MRKIYLCLIILMGFLSAPVVAEKTQPLRALPEEQDSSKVKGTYQIQMINTRDLPHIPYNLEQVVEAKRDKDKIVYFSLSSTVRIKVLPKSEIEKSDFKPLNHIEYVRE